MDMDGSDPKAPYAAPVLGLTTSFHALTAIYCYTSYYSSHLFGSTQTGSGSMLGMVGYGSLAAMGLWCVLFASGRGRVSSRTGADKRTSGFPFKNVKAYNSKFDKRKKG